MRLCVYYVAKRHSVCRDDDKFWSESICICLEVREFPQSVQEYLDLPSIPETSVLNTGVDFDY